MLYFGTLPAAELKMVQDFGIWVAFLEAQNMPGTEHAFEGCAPGYGLDLIGRGSQTSFARSLGSFSCTAAQVGNALALHTGVLVEVCSGGPNLAQLALDPASLHEKKNMTRIGVFAFCSVACGTGGDDAEPLHEHLRWCELGERPCTTEEYLRDLGPALPVLHSLHLFRGNAARQQVPVGFQSGSL